MRRGARHALNLVVWECQFQASNCHSRGLVFLCLLVSWISCIIILCFSGHSLNQSKVFTCLKDTLNLQIKNLVLHFIGYAELTSLEGGRLWFIVLNSSGCLSRLKCSSSFIGTFPLQFLLMLYMLFATWFSSWVSPKCLKVLLVSKACYVNIVVALHGFMLEGSSCEQSLLCWQ